MSTGKPTRQDLLELAHKLRHALPSWAPLAIAERVQHAITRLESYARQQPIPDADAQLALEVGAAMLKACSKLRDPPR